MQLDRNKDTNHGLGKYGLILCRAVSEVTADQMKRRAGKPDCFVEIESQAIDLGAGPKGNFFVIRYKDQFAEPALRAYAAAVRARIEEISRETSLDCAGATQTMKELAEYAAEIDQEADTAEVYANQGKSKLPD